MCRFRAGFGPSSAQCMLKSARELRHLVDLFVAGVRLKFVPNHPIFEVTEVRAPNLKPQSRRLFASNLELLELEFFMRTEVAIERFLVSRRAQQATPNTISGYEWALGKMLEMFPDELPSSRTDMDEVLASHSDLALASLQGLWRKLRTFWIWAEGEGIAENVMARISAPPKKPKLPRIFTENEIARLLAATRDRRNYAMIALFLDTGMRVGEAASIRRISITTMGILISGKTGERIVPVSSPVLQLLRRQGKGDAVWVAHNGKKGPMTASGLQQAVRKAMVRGRIEASEAGSTRAAPHIRQEVSREWWRHVFPSGLTGS